MSKGIKFYYDFLSPPSRAVWLGLKLGKTSFEDCPVALRKREQLTDEYKKINKFQKVPALVDGDFHLAESTAMVRYLADKGQFSEQLYPKALIPRTRVDECVAWQQLTVRVACSMYFRNAWLFPMNGIAPKPKPDEIEKLVKQVELNLGLMERLWMDKEFLTGSQLTVADLFGAVEIEQLKLCQYNVNEKQFPKVAKWLERVRQAANPYFDEAHDFVYKKAKQAAQAKL